MEALVIMHLSSLDSFSWERGLKKGTELAQRMIHAIESVDRPLYIVDQSWTLDEDNSYQLPRVLVSNAASEYEDVNHVYFDEERHSWKKFLRTFLQRLEDNGITKVVLGGVWFNPNLKTGCVTTLYNYLKKHFKGTVRIDKRLVGCE